MDQRQRSARGHGATTGQAGPHQPLPDAVPAERYLTRRLASAWGIDQGRIDQHAARLALLPELTARISELFTPAQAKTDGSSPDPELALYNGFVPRGDQQVYPAVRRAGADELSRLGKPLQ